MMYVPIYEISDHLHYALNNKVQTKAAEYYGIHFLHCYKELQASVLCHVTPTQLCRALQIQYLDSNGIIYIYVFCRSCRNRTFDLNLLYYIRSKTA